MGRYHNNILLCIQNACIYNITVGTRAYIYKYLFPLLLYEYMITALPNYRLIGDSERR